LTFKELFINTVLSFLRKKMPQLAISGKEDPLARPSQTPLLPDTAQTILKCITGALANPSTELFQEINQITSEIRIILEKNGSLQTQKPPQPVPLPQAQTNANVTNSQNTFELLQSMVNSLNINNNLSNTGFSSPDKILTPPTGIQSSQIQSIGMLGSNSVIRPTMQSKY
jgi:hypothetical protein